MAAPMRSLSAHAPVVVIINNAAVDKPNVALHLDPALGPNRIRWIVADDHTYNIELPPCLFGGMRAGGAPPGELTISPSAPKGEYPYGITCTTCDAARVGPVIIVTD